MLPSLVTQFIILVKDTSLASIIGYMDLTKAAQTVNQREIRPFELYLFIAVVYWVLCYGMSLWSRALERRMGSPACRSGDHRVRERGTGRRPRPPPRRDSGRGFRRRAWWSDPPDALAPSARTWSTGRRPVRPAKGNRWAAYGSPWAPEEVAGVRARDRVGLGSAAAARGRRKREPGKTRRRWPAICRPRRPGRGAGRQHRRDGGRRLHPGRAVRRAGGGGSSVAAVPRAGPPEPARGTLHLGRGALRSGMESFRAGARTGSAGLRGVLGQAPGAPARPAPSSGSGKPTSEAGTSSRLASTRRRSTSQRPGSEPPTRCSARLARSARSAARTGHGMWARLVRDFPDGEAALRVRAVLRQPSRAVRRRSLDSSIPSKGRSIRTNPVIQPRPLDAPFLDLAPRRCI